MWLNRRRCFCLLLQQIEGAELVTRANAPAHARLKSSAFMKRHFFFYLIAGGTSWINRLCVEKATNRNRRMQFGLFVTIRILRLSISSWKLLHFLPVIGYQKLSWVISYVDRKTNSKIRSGNHQVFSRVWISAAYIEPLLASTRKGYSS